jgi:hypothetical protein
MTAIEVEDNARKLKLDGKELYDVPLERWMKLFDDQNKIIFLKLQESAYKSISFALSFFITHV